MPEKRPSAFARPRFYVWKKDILYLGSAITHPTPHKMAHHKFMACLEGHFTVHSGHRTVKTRSCLLASGHWQDNTLIDCSNAVSAAWLLSPFTQDYPALASIMAGANGNLCYDHPLEDDLIRHLREARDVPRPDSGKAVRDGLRALLLPGMLNEKVFRIVDHRVVETARRIQSMASTNLPLQPLAQEADLSYSYLEKLFKEHTGLPIVQYRLMFRSYMAAILLALGYSITEAAMKAGFSSPSHFSRTHRALTGETASELFVKSGAEAVIEKSVVRTILRIARGSEGTTADRATITPP